MADDRIGLEVEHGFADTPPEHAAKGLDHLRRHIAVSRGLVGHDVAHTAHGKRRSSRWKRHREELDAGASCGESSLSMPAMTATWCPAAAREATVSARAPLPVLSGFGRRCRGCA